MTTPTPSPTIPERVLDALGPAINDRAGDLLPDFIDGLTDQLEATDALLRPATVGGRFATIFDLDHTPMPAWLGAAIGTRVPPGLTVEQQRTYVRDQANWRRGTLDAIAAAVRTLLTGQHVGFVERARHTLDVDHPWRLVIRVLAAETTATEAEILAAANTQKPVGLIIDAVEFVPAVTYGDLATEFDDYEDLGEEFDDYAELVPNEDLPGARWRHKSSVTQRYARTASEAPTYADRVVLYPSYRDARDAREDTA